MCSVMKQLIYGMRWRTHLILFLISFFSFFFRKPIKIYTDIYIEILFKVNLKFIEMLNVHPR